MPCQLLSCHSSATSCISVCCVCTWTVTFLALSSFLLLECKQTPSFAANAVAAKAAEPAPGRTAVPGLVDFAVPGLDVVLVIVPLLGSTLPAASVASCLFILLAQESTGCFSACTYLLTMHSVTGQQ